MKTHKDYIDSIIPHRLGMVDIMHFALTQMTFDVTKSIEIYIEGKLRVKGNTTAFTYPAIEAGIINARALLEFLGLQVDPKDSRKLKERRTKRYDDYLFIEDFKDSNVQLNKITVDDVRRHYPGRPEDAEASLARIIHIGHKEIAHPTLGSKSLDNDFEMLEIAARGVRALTVSFFFTKLGVPPPKSPVSDVR